MTDPAYGAIAERNGAARTTNQRVVASFDNYAAAQDLVDRMSDGGFPVEHVRIVGDDLRTVERVTGRMTTGKAALAGASGGAWIGALIGLLFLLFAVGPFLMWIWVLVLPIIFGALWGAVLGATAHWSTRGRRDFSSVETLVASRYDVCVASEHANEAIRYLPVA